MKDLVNKTNKQNLLVLENSKHNNDARMRHPSYGLLRSGRDEVINILLRV